MITPEDVCGMALAQAGGDRDRAFIQLAEAYLWMARNASTGMSREVNPYAEVMPPKEQLAAPVLLEDEA